MPTTRAAVAEIEALYRQHGPALLLFATAFAGDRSRAQDAVHHVFLKLIEDGTLQQAGNKKAYLFACVRNALLNDSRRLSRTVPLDSDAPWFEAAGASQPPFDPAEALALRRALLSLSSEQREIVILHAWGDLTFLEISGLLAISHNTAASRYRYALARLRDSLSNIEPAKEDSRAGSE